MPIRNQSLGEAAEDTSRKTEDEAEAPTNEPRSEAPVGRDSGVSVESSQDATPAPEAEAADDDQLPELPPRMPGGGRIRARMAAVQAIYQWRMSGTEIAELILQFATGGRLRSLDRAYFEMLLRGVVHDVTGLEQAFDVHLSRPAVQLDPVEYAILLLATYELRECPEIPFAAVINEATNLAKIFGATDGHRFVNGVLDATARDLRPVETARKPRR